MQQRTPPTSVSQKPPPSNEAEEEYYMESENEFEESRSSSSSSSSKGDVVYSLYVFYSNYFSSCNVQTIILKTCHINQQRIVRVQVQIEEN